MPIIVRITTVPISLKVLLKGQLLFMKNNGFRVFAVSANGIEVEALKKQEGCEHFAIPFSRSINAFSDIFCIVKLYFYLKKIQPDIVHTHTPKAGFIGMIASYFANVPIRLHTIAGLPWAVEKGMKKKLLKVVERVTIAASSKVYVNSKNLLEYLKDENFFSNKLSVLGNGTSNGIDVNYFNISSDIQQKKVQLYQKAGSKKDTFIWLFVGRIVKDKGIQELVDAFTALQIQYPDDQFWLVGEEETELDPLSEKHLKTINANPNIIKWGFQNDVRPFYNAANMLIFPSYREGFPNVPMQAALMNCGLILSNINGCNEIVIHQESGLLVQTHSSKDILEKMLFSKSNASKIDDYKVVAKQNIIDRFSQDFVWNNLLSEYKNLLAKKKII